MAITSSPESSSAITGKEFRHFPHVQHTDIKTAALRLVSNVGRPIRILLLYKQNNKLINIRKN